MNKSILNLSGNQKGVTRRKFLWSVLLGTIGGSSFLMGKALYLRLEKGMQSKTFIARAKDYQMDIARIILSGFKELGVDSTEIRGKKILLKPNLVEPHADKPQINTHPLFVRGAVEAFLHLGASEVYIAEGPGHCRDTIYILEESGFSEILTEDMLPFVDINYDGFFKRANIGKYAECETFYLPKILQEVDWIVSMPKLKTHHWTGVTLAMKNLFGLMPGAIYGWPKNELHRLGIYRSILDINATVKPHFAIVDGIIGMEGDGPIMGSPKNSGVIVMGRNLPAVDATCSRIMEINPLKIPYLNAASGWLGPVREKHIKQMGESIEAVRTKYKLEDNIPSHKNIYL